MLFRQPFNPDLPITFTLDALLLASSTCREVSPWAIWLKVLWWGASQSWPPIELRWPISLTKACAFPRSQHTQAKMRAVLPSCNLRPVCAWSAGRPQQQQQRPPLRWARTVDADAQQPWARTALAAGLASLLLLGGGAPAEAAGKRQPPVQETANRCTLEALDKFAGGCGMEAPRCACEWFHRL